MDNAKLRIRDCCLRLLKYRPRSKREIECRLKKKRFPQNLIREVIEEFVSCGLIDDGEFARFWVNWRLKVNPRGRGFIRRELREQGLDEDLIEKSLKQISAKDELLRARQLAQKRYQQMKNIGSIKIKRRIYAYLNRRGFQEQIIWDALNSLH